MLISKYQLSFIDFWLFLKMDQPCRDQSSSKRWVHWFTSQIRPGHFIKGGLLTESLKIMRIGSFLRTASWRLRGAQVQCSKEDTWIQINNKAQSERDKDEQRAKNLFNLRFLSFQAWGKFLPENKLSIHLPRCRNIKGSHFPKLLTCICSICKCNCPHYLHMRCRNTYTTTKKNAHNCIFTRLKRATASRF